MSYFKTTRVDNDEEVEVIDAFLTEVRNRAITGWRYGSNRTEPHESDMKFASDRKTEIIAWLGILAAFLTCAFLWNSSNRIIILLSVVSLVGYGHTHFQLLRSDNFIRTIEDVKTDVIDFDDGNV